MKCSSYNCKNEGTVNKFDRGELKHYCQPHINGYNRLKVIYEVFINKVKKGIYRKHGVYWTTKYGATYSEGLEKRYKKQTK